MTEPKDVIARKLAHDVGKYVTRAARNLPKAGSIPPVLVDMLRRDVFGAPSDARTPMQTFETLAATIADPRIDDVRARFTHALSLQALATDDAVRAVAADALAIERALTSLAHDLSEAR
jgi:hypothetical protein